MAARRIAAGTGNTRAHQTRGEAMRTLSGLARPFALCLSIIFLALSGARAMGVALPNTATAQELFNSCVANGGAKWDHSALVKALERMANHDVAKG